MANKLRTLLNISRNGHFGSSKIGSLYQNCSRGLQTSLSCNEAQKILMPSLSPTMVEGEIVRWLKKEGDTVSPGDILCEIQTDKSVNTFDTDEEGILAKILKPENSKGIPVGTLIGVLVEEGDDWQNVVIPDHDNPQSDTSTETSSSGQENVTSESVRLGPAVKRIIDEFGVDPSQVQGTGPHGMLVKGDVLAYVESKGLKAVTPKPVPTPAQIEKPVEQPKPAATVKHATPTPPRVQVVQPTPVQEREGLGYTDIPVSNMRAVIAKKLTESKTTIPHSYATIDCNMGNVLKLRKELIAEGVKVSVNDFIIKAVGTALQQVPEVNIRWTKDGAQLLSEVDISVAVATEDGLITPIVKDVPALGLQEISEKVRELAGKAKTKRLQLHEFQGGSFTISNLGMFGITEFSAVINPPQACILAVGTSRVEVDPDLSPITLMSVTLSADARVVSESAKARFLEAFRDVMENPMLMITQPTQNVKMEALFANFLINALNDLKDSKNIKTSNSQDGGSICQLIDRLTDFYIVKTVTRWNGVRIHQGKVSRSFQRRHGESNADDYSAYSKCKDGSAVCQVKKDRTIK